MDFSNIKDKSQIHNKLGSVNRQVGLYGGQYFEPFTVYNFTIIVSCLQPEINNSSVPKWTPQQLAKLKRITEYNQIKVKILENDPGSKNPMITKSVRVREDGRFKSVPWKNVFNDAEAIVNPNILVEIIRFCQIINNLKVFL